MNSPPGVGARQPNNHEGHRRSANPSPTRRLSVLFLSLLVSLAPVIPAVLDAAEPARSGALLTDVHPPDRCPYTHPHLLCVQIQNSIGHPAGPLKDNLTVLCTPFRGSPDCCVALSLAFGPLQPRAPPVHHTFF